MNNTGLSKFVDVVKMIITSVYRRPLSNNACFWWIMNPYISVQWENDKFKLSQNVWWKTDTGDTVVQPFIYHFNDQNRLNQNHHETQNCMKSHGNAETRYASAVEIYGSNPNFNTLVIIYSAKLGEFTNNSIFLAALGHPRSHIT